MTYQYSDIEFAMCAVRVLAIVAVVALFAYSVKSRAVFIAGTVGSLFGYIMPSGSRLVNGSGEAIFLSKLQWTSSHIFTFGVIGAIAACGVVLSIQHLPRHKKRFSVRVLLLVTTAIATVLGLLRAVGYEGTT